MFLLIFFSILPFSVFCQNTEDPHYWLKLLDKRNDISVRIAACQSLGAFGESEADISVPALMDVLKEPYTVIRLTAPEKLSASELLDTTPDLEGQLHAAAATALGQIGPAAKKAVPLIINLLGQDRKESAPDIKLYRQILEKAGSLDKVPAHMTRRFIKVWNGDNLCVRAAHDTLIAIGAPAVSSLIEALSSPIINRRSVAARVLGNIGAAASPAIPKLQQLAENDEFEGARKNAREAIEKIIAESQ